MNNAGGGHRDPFLEVPLDTWNAVIALNLTGAFVCAQRAARIMVDSGTEGRIVNVTSVHEHVPLREAAAYCAAKGGLGLLTKVMALELGEHGINVNSVAPGEIATGMTGGGGRAAGRRTRARACSLGRPRPTPARWPPTIAYLASPGARYITGGSFVGGRRPPAHAPPSSIA